MCSIILISSWFDKILANYGIVWLGWRWQECLWMAFLHFFLKMWVGVRKTLKRWNLPLRCTKKMGFRWNLIDLRGIFTPGADRGKRIMDLDQYLEKMITNTEFIWIQPPRHGDEGQQNSIVQASRRHALYFSSTLRFYWERRACGTTAGWREVSWMALGAPALDGNVPSWPRHLHF